MKMKKTPVRPDQVFHLHPHRVDILLLNIPLFFLDCCFTWIYREVKKS